VQGVVSEDSLIGELEKLPKGPYRRHHLALRLASSIVVDAIAPSPLLKAAVAFMNNAPTPTRGSRVRYDQVANNYIPKFAA
jgi:hypothetical protein